MKTQHLMAGIIALFVLSGHALGQSGWNDDGSVVRLTTSTDRVGIGTSAPKQKLHIEGGSDASFNDGSGYLINGDQDGVNLVMDNNEILARNNGGESPLYFQADGGDLKVHTNQAGGTEFIIKDDGNVGIGTTNPQSKLAVNGTITAREVEVTSTGWPDHVFADGYRLRPLDEVEAYIKANRHLPDMPSAAEVSKNGVSLGKMQATLLQKVEELTLYVIDLQKENEALKTRVASLEEEQ